MHLFFVSYILKKGGDKYTQNFILVGYIWQDGLQTLLLCLVIMKVFMPLE